MDANSSVDRQEWGRQLVDALVRHDFSEAQSLVQNIDVAFIDESIYLRIASKIQDIAPDHIDAMLVMLASYLRKHIGTPYQEINLLALVIEMAFLLNPEHQNDVAKNPLRPEAQE